MLRVIRWIAYLLIGLAIGFGISKALKQKTMETEIESEAEIPSLGKFTDTGKNSATEESTNENTNKDSIKSEEGKKSNHTSANPAIGGPFTLIDQNGKTVTDKDFLGKYSLLFFGFTYCPQVCPTELHKMARILDMLGDKANNIQPVFVSVDPGRDTPEVMKEYVSQFHPKLIGLTGSKEQIENIKNAYKVFSKKIEMGGKDNYMVNHSAFMYLMNPEGKNIAIYPSKDTAEQIAKDIKSKI